LAILTGTIYYTFVAKPDSYKGKDFWKTSLVLEEDQKEKAKELGVSFQPAQGQIPSDYLRLKRNVLTRDGRKVDPVRVVDAKKNDWPNNMIIGNGSKARVKFSVIEQNEGSPYLYLEAIQIVELVEYNRQEDFDEEAGTDISSYKSQEDEESFGEDTKTESKNTTANSHDDFEE